MELLINIQYIYVYSEIIRPQRLTVVTMTMKIAFVPVKGEIKIWTFLQFVFYESAEGMSSYFRLLISYFLVLTN